MARRDFEVQITNAQVENLLQAMPKGLFQATKQGFLAAVRDFLADFTARRLSGRISGGRGHGKGLNRRTGQFARAFHAVVSGSNYANLKGKVHVQGELEKKIAFVHELGTVGKGGRLPDIRPVRGPYLVFEVENGQLVFAKKVSIPPRLEFRERWSMKSRQQRNLTLIKRTIREKIRDMNRKAKGRGKSL